MIDFTEIPYDRDDWELFSRDFLQAIGLHGDVMKFYQIDMREKAQLQGGLRFPI